LEVKGQTRKTGPIRVGGTAPHLALVVAPYYREISDELLEGSRSAISEAGGSWEVIEVPGALEIPAAIEIAGSTGRFDGFVALGCVVRGETSHYETVCQESARGITILNLRGMCIGNGILTVDFLSQARKRADPCMGDKGGDAARAALTLIALSRRFDGQKKVSNRQSDN